MATKERTPTQVLADLVSDRLDELGHTITTAVRFSEQVDASGRGLSRRTWSSLSAGSDEGREYHPRTMALAERTLRWKPGTIPAILAGKQEHAEVLEDDEDGLTMAQMARELRELRERVERLTSGLRGAFGADPDDRKRPSEW